MTLDIKRIKSTRLGRLWLSRFVELVWDAIGSAGQERLRFARCEAAPLDGRVQRMFIGAPVGTAERAEDGRLTACGLLGERLPVVNLRGRDGWGRWLTPLGVEVYLYGRKQAGKRGGR